MRYLVIICVLVTACEFSADKDVTFKLSSEDSLVYEMISDNCLLAVYQQKIKSDRPSLIQVMIYTPDKSNLLSNADLHLTVINKGRRKPIREIRSITPGVYEGVIELNFSGQSTLEFEVLTSEFKNTMMLDQEINEN